MAKTQPDSEQNYIVATTKIKNSDLANTACGDFAFFT